MDAPLHHQNRFDIIVYTAVDYNHRQGAGMGVVQRAERVCARAPRNDRILHQEHKCSYTRKGLIANDIKTVLRAHMLALIQALGLVRRTLRVCALGAAQLRKVTIFSKLHLAVHTVNDYIRDPGSLREVAHTNDRLIIRKILTRIRRLSRHGLDVAVAVSCGTDKAEQRAETLARQGGRKAWKGRREA